MYIALYQISIYLQLYYYIYYKTGYVAKASDTQAVGRGTHVAGSSPVQNI